MGWLLLVAIACAGCFSKPGFTGGGGDGGPADGTGDTPQDSTPCTWTAWQPAAIEVLGLEALGFQATGPWMSPDGLVLFFHAIQQAPVASIYRAVRPTVGEPFDPIGFGYQDAPSMSQSDTQPFVSDDQLEIWYDDNAGNLNHATRPSTMTDFAVVGAVPGHRGAWLSSDGLELLSSSGANNGYDEEELYRSRRSSTSVEFTTFEKLVALNDPLHNDSSPTQAGSLVLWQRRLAGGKSAIYQAIDHGDGTFSDVQPFGPAAGTNSYGTPHLTRDGSRLVYVEILGTAHTLRMLERTCVP